KQRLRDQAIEKRIVRQQNAAWQSSRTIDFLQCRRGCSLVVIGNGDGRVNAGLVLDLVRGVYIAELPKSVSCQVPALRADVTNVDHHVPRQFALDLKA